MELQINYIADYEIGNKEDVGYCVRTAVIEVKELIKYINNTRDNGNIEGEKGFSASLFLSQLIKELENA